MPSYGLYNDTAFWVRRAQADTQVQQYPDSVLLKTPGDDGYKCDIQLYFFASGYLQHHQWKCLITTVVANAASCQGIMKRWSKIH